MSETLNSDSPRDTPKASASVGNGSEKDPSTINALQVDEKPLSPPSFPEGGFQAWATVLGAFLVQVCGFGYTTSFGVYQDFYVREYITNASPSAISWIGSVNAFLLISGGAVAGRFYDRGYFYTLLYGGSFLTVFSLFMLSLAKPDNYYQVFLSQGIGAGLGGGITYVPSVAVVSHYFAKRRALAMTLVAAGSSVGSVIHPIMLNNTLGTRLGFGNAVRASAGLVGGLLLIACLLMRTRIPVQRKADTSSGPILKRLAHDGAYVAATLGLMVFSAGFYFPQFYLQLDSTSHHLNKTFSFYALVIMNLSSCIGRVTPGLYIHTLGVGNMITIAAGCCSIIIFGMIGLNTIASVVLLGVFFGFFSGMFVALMGPLMAILTDDLSELGVRMGVAFFFSGVGGLIGTPIDGALLSDRFTWWRPAVFSGITTLFGFFSFALMLYLVRRKKISKVST